jgi:hypothetical protein
MTARGYVVFGVVGLLALLGCQKTKSVKESPTPGKEQKMTKLTVESAAFAAGEAIPKKYAYRGEGDNVSPPLTWAGAPEGTRSFALVCDDPDAPSPRNPRENPWVHWVVYNIPPDRTALEEGDAGGVQGKSDFKERGWGGPMPPPGSGTHRYFFKVYALDTKLALGEGATKAELLKAMEGHILGQGEIHGTYTRQ